MFPGGVPPFYIPIIARSDLAVNGNRPRYAHISHRFPQGFPSPSSMLCLALLCCEIHFQRVHYACFSGSVSGSHLSLYQEQSVSTAFPAQTENSQVFRRLKEGGSAKHSLCPSFMELPQASAAADGKKREKEFLRARLPPGKLFRCALDFCRKSVTIIFEIFSGKI